MSALMLRMAACLAPALLFIAPTQVAAAPIAIDFEGLTAMGNFLHSPVPDEAKLSNQLLATYGALFRSEAQPYVAVVDLGSGHATSGTNGIGGVNEDAVLAYENPVLISFWDTANPLIKAVTDFVSIRGDNNGGGHPITLTAFDILDNVLGQDEQLDLGGTTLMVTVPGIHSIRVSDNLAGTVSWDDLTFNPLRPVPEPATSVLLAIGLVGIAGRLRGSYRR